MTGVLEVPAADERSEALRVGFRRFGLISSVVALTLGLIVTFGWLANIPVLLSGLPHLVPAHALSAMAASLLNATVLMCYSGRAQKLISGSAIAIAVSSVLVLAGIAGYMLPPFGTSFVDLPEQLDPERMAPNSLVCILFSASALAIIASSHSTRLYRVAQAFALGAITISVLALIGYSYSVEPFYGIGEYRAMSLPGAVVYLLLGLSLLFLNPEKGVTRMLTHDTSAGVISRRLYAAVALVPPIVGFLSLLGAVSLDLYDLPFAVAIVVVVNMLLFSAVIAMTSRKIEQSDRSRELAEEDLRRSRERLRELSQSIQVMQEEERIRIAREVHDELGQLLTAIKMDMSLLRSELEPGGPLHKRVSATVDLVNSTIKTVQRITSELRPSILDNLGLAAAIEWQAGEFESRYGIPVELEIPDEYLPVTSTIATAVFRIFQETLTNIARHAQAEHIRVLLEERNNQLAMEVEDDGIGLADEALEQPQSFGIMGMRERAKLVGGVLELGPAGDRGTRVRVTIPLPESLEDEPSEPSAWEQR
jgi:signal transduction histidine kinase